MGPSGGGRAEGSAGQHPPATGKAVFGAHAEERLAAQGTRAWGEAWLAKGGHRAMFARPVSPQGLQGAPWLHTARLSAVALGSRRNVRALPSDGTRSLGHRSAPGIARAVGQPGVLPFQPQQCRTESPPGHYCPLFLLGGGTHTVCAPNHDPQGTLGRSGSQQVNQALLVVP